MGTHRTPLTKFLEEAGRKDPELRQKVGSKLKRMESMFHFHTVGDVWGSLHPELPATPADKGRCLSVSPSRLALPPSIARRTTLLARAVGLPAAVARRFVSAIEAAPKPLHKVKPTKSEWYLGDRSRQRLRSARDYHVVDASDLYGDVPQQRRLWVPGGLPRKIGPVYDQGRRGTCVANAAAALFKYVIGGSAEPSRQFLFHQCKMIDGIPESSGTYLECAMKVFSDRRISGYHLDWGTADAGIVAEHAWPYVPHRIEGNPAHTPPPKRYERGLYYDHRWGNSSGEVIRCALRTGKLVSDLRAILFRGGPVLIGVDLYQSFNNPNSRRTGWITMPLVPGEMRVGGHAMLVVGFDDTRDVFLVRNSWGSGWAPENQFGYPGHAIIPYRYFSLYGHGGYALRRANRFRCRVEPGARLDPRSSAQRFSGLKAAARKPTGKKSKRTKKRRSLLSKLLRR